LIQTLAKDVSGEERTGSHPGVRRGYSKEITGEEALHCSKPSYCQNLSQHLAMSTVTADREEQASETVSVAESLASFANA
jgi:hypothetical protein